MAEGKIIDRLIIALGLNTEEVEKGINNTVSTVKGGLKELLVGAVLPAVGALATGELVQQFTAEITQVDRLSKSLGMNIEQLQAWRGAAEMAGIEADEIGELFVDLNDWMVDAAQNKSGAMYEYIEKGWLPSVQKANGEMKSTEQYALELADALKALGEQQGSGVARQIGISNANVAALLQRGSADISKSLAQAKEMGVYTAEDAKAARELDVSMKSLAHSMRMMLLPVFRVLAPALSWAANGMQLLSKHSEVLIPILVIISGILVKMAYTYLVDMSKNALKFLSSPWGALLAVLLGIGLLLEDFIGWLNGDKAAFAEFYEEIFGSAKEAKKTLMELWQQIQPFLELIGYVMALGAALTILSSLLISITTIMGLFGITSLAALGPIVLAVGAIIAVVLLLHTYWDDLVAAFKTAFDWLTDKIQWLGDKLSWLAEKADFLPNFDFKDVAKMAGFYGGNDDNSLATPATAGTTNNNITKETKIDAVINNTIQGNANTDAVRQLQDKTSYDLTGVVAQANASQDGI